MPRLAAGFSIHRNQVTLDRPIKDLGMHGVTVTLHPEVVAQVKLNVARTVEEAALQASASRSRNWLRKRKPRPSSRSPNCSTIIGAANDFDPRDAR